MSAFQDKKTRVGILTAAGAAIVASACCVIPLRLVGVGLGGAWIRTLTALEPARPIFMAIALAALGDADYREFRTSTAPDCACELTMRDWLRRGLLVLGAVAILGLIASPWIIGGFAPTAASKAVIGTGTALEEVVLEVEGMKCASCNVTVSRALTSVDGVQNAHVTFSPPQAVVRFDPSRVTVGELIEATTDIGYPSKPKTSS